MPMTGLSTSTLPLFRNCISCNALMTAFICILARQAVSEERRAANLQWPRSVKEVFQVPHLPCQV